jgi:hypothetical protein
VAWIRRKIEASGDGKAGIVSGGIFGVTSVAALYSVGM